MEPSVKSWVFLCSFVIHDLMVSAVHFYAAALFLHISQVIA